MQLVYLVWTEELSRLKAIESEGIVGDAATDFQKLHRQRRQRQKVCCNRVGAEMGADRTVSSE